MQLSPALSICNRTTWRSPFCGGRLDWSLRHGAGRDDGRFPGLRDRTSPCSSQRLGRSALVGAFCATLGSNAPPRIVQLNWLLSVAGALALPMALALVLTGRRSAEPFIAAGGVAAIVGMAAFASAIALCWVNNGEAAKRSRSRVGAADEGRFGQGRPVRGVG